MGELSSKETPLVDGPLNKYDISWLASVSSLGSIVGTFIFGWLTFMIGCKRAMLFLGLPSVTFWLFVYFGDTFYHLLFGREIFVYIDYYYAFLLLNIIFICSVLLIAPNNRTILNGIHGRRHSMWYYSLCFGNIKRRVARPNVLSDSNSQKLWDPFIIHRLLVD